MENKELTVEYFAKNAADIVARVRDGEEFCFEAQIFSVAAFVLLSKDLSESFVRLASEQTEKYSAFREHDFDSEDIEKITNELGGIIDVAASGEPRVLRIDDKPVCLSLMALE